MDNKMAEHIYVIKRDGSKVPVSFDQVLQRIRKLAGDLEHVNADIVSQKVCSQLMDGMNTSQLDEFAGEICAMMQSRYHPNYGFLAARIVIDNHHKNTPDTLIGCTEKIKHLLSDSYVENVVANEGAYQSMIDYNRDFMFDYFGFKTLEKSYLLKSGGNVVERPQHMWMRVAIQLHGASLTRVKETYDALSGGYFIHATPTLFNSGGKHPQLSSCFLLKMASDSITGIYKTLGDCAEISKWAGGIGLNIHNVRARSSRIRGTNGESTGIVPMLRVFNNTARYVNQGGKRNGSFAIYLEPWHGDIEDFLRLRLNQGAEEERARDLFYALWIPDLFMKRVEANTDWTLMCPDECPGLSDCFGDKFEELYESYEKDGKGRKTMPAQKLWQMILDAQIQTGTPYLLYKDAVNRKNNQANLGVIKSSNLCVAPETFVLTDVGSHMIQNLIDKPVVIWNGSEWSKVIPQKTGINQSLIKIQFESGNIIECTKYHKFILENKTTTKIAELPRKEAVELKAGDKLLSYYNNYGEYIDGEVILEIIDEGRISDTYCFNEPVNHAGVFNGILTGNCSEIVEYTDENETAVCNLGSLALPKFVSADGKSYDFGKLRKYTRILARNLDILIDKNYYPTPECATSNKRNRPIGIGVQGLADVFAKMKLSWTSVEAERLNREIFENIYFAAISESYEIAKENVNIWRGIEIDNASGAYNSFKGSPLSQGKLQCDLWESAPITTYLPWNELRICILEYGVRNSLSIALMPTASTSQILGNNECFEPFTSNLYSRSVLAGDFMVVNKYLVDELVSRGLWNTDIRTQLMADNGSVQGIAAIPSDIKELYRTVWEIPQKTLINMSVARAPFVCQSQSLNLFLAEPTYSKMTSMHMYAWKQGLKTGCYYLRTKAAASAQQFTVEPCISCSA